MATYRYNNAKACRSRRDRKPLKRWQGPGKEGLSMGDTSSFHYSILSLTVIVKINQHSHLLNFSALLAAHSMVVLMINLAVLMVGECASY